MLEKKMKKKRIDMNYDENVYTKPINGLKFEEYFTENAQKFVTKIFNCEIKKADGTIVYKKEGILAPDFWSQTAVEIFASKYFCIPLNLNHFEFSISQTIQRVTRTITQFGEEQEYFATETDAEIFQKELYHLLINQMASFNSPVWFNLGVNEKPQCSACFINSVEDDMDSILDLVKIEGNLFKQGSGTGTNFSPLRGKNKPLSNGGVASGPVSFMKGFDTFAGVIKSAGKMRRAAKMVILDVDHPDILEFINCKAKEEKKAHALIQAGYDSSFAGEAYSSVFFQNSNNSVRVTDDFMYSVDFDRDEKAIEIMDNIAQAIYDCGDPGIQFDVTTNDWNTCKISGRINASNPCGEFVFLDDSACNLASLNLMKFLRKDFSFDVEAFKKAIDIMITAQDIIINKSSYPTKKIEANSKDFRPLGLGYTNLGALLMVKGLPYDSDEGRKLAQSITALMTAEAYTQSARMAKHLGSFAKYKENKTSVNDILSSHCFIAKSKDKDCPIMNEAQKLFESIATQCPHGVRNAQVTLLAPTGTISFIMDCDTTGIEPDISLVKYKNFSDGTKKRLVNKTVKLALVNLGYDDDSINKILNYIEKNGSLEDCYFLDHKHLPIFDCAIKTKEDGRFISPIGHLKMMEVVQPFLSGAISKTVNVQEDSTVEDIKEIIFKAWSMSLKSICIYRENSKKIQPLITKKETEKTEKTEKVKYEKPVIERLEKIKPKRRRLPDERYSITHKFQIANHEGYLTVGLYRDGSPGELFLNMTKMGSSINGLTDSLAMAISIALQYGIPLKTFIRKYRNIGFEPSGITSNQEIQFAKSIPDYVFRWLESKFPEAKEKVEKEEAIVVDEYCTICDGKLQRAGKCIVCTECGETSGCS
jgi:ribonucleoside-diphosphate reductase alpha chain